MIGPTTLPQAAPPQQQQQLPHLPPQADAHTAKGALPQGADVLTAKGALPQDASPQLRQQATAHVPQDVFAARSAAAPPGAGGRGSSVSTEAAMPSARPTPPTQPAMVVGLPALPPAKGTPTFPVV